MRLVRALFCQTCAHWPLFQSLQHSYFTVSHLQIELFHLALFIKRSPTSANRHKAQRHIQLLFFLISITAGPRLIHVVNHDTWRRVMRQVCHHSKLDSDDSHQAFPTGTTIGDNLGVRHCATRSPACRHKSRHCRRVRKILWTQDNDIVRSTHLMLPIMMSSSADTTVVHVKIVIGAVHGLSITILDT